MTSEDAHGAAPVVTQATSVRTTTTPGSRWLVAGLVMWLIVLLIISTAVWRDKRTPGRVGVTPRRWPARSALVHELYRPQLIMFLHPRCVCSRASLSELSALVRSMQGRVAIEIAFGMPVGAPASWSQGELWDAARDIPGARVVTDRDCIEATRFGALTSGYTTLYDTTGSLMFAGGVTTARGTQGDNPGLNRLSTLMAGGSAVRPTSPVFGCALTAPSSSRRSSDAR